MEASISLNNVSKRYGERHVLKQLSFGVERGSIFYVVGPSGAGKTTLLHILTALTKNDNGTIHLHGMPLQENIWKIKNLCGFVPETNVLHPEYTILENLRLQGVLQGYSAAETDNRAIHLLEEFDLVSIANDFPATLSYGVQRLATFTMALVHEPELLFLDEPTANLDYATKHRIWKYLFHHHGEMTVFGATRNYSEAEEIADRILILHKGEIVTDGTPDKLRQDFDITPEFVILFQKDSERHYGVFKQFEGISDLRRDGRSYTFRLDNPSRFLHILRHFEEDAVDTFYQISPDLNHVLFGLIQQNIRSEGGHQ